MTFKSSRTILQNITATEPSSGTSRLLFSIVLKCVLKNYRTNLPSSISH